MTTLKLIATQAKVIEKDYIDENGHGANCYDIALKLVQSLRGEGKLAQLKVVNCREGRLIPLKYSGEVRWSAHFICVCDGEVWDPVIGFPVKQEDYIKQIFGEETVERTYTNLWIVSGKQI